MDGEVKDKCTVLVKERTNKSFESVVRRVVREVEGSPNVVVSFSDVVESDDEALLHALISAFRRIGVTGVQTDDVGQSGRGIDALVLQVQELLHDECLLRLRYAG